MSGTTLGTAYVQVVPSAQGIKGSLAKAIGPEADAAGMSAGKSLAGKLKGVLVGAGIGLAIGAGIKKSLTEGAALEQSLGGVETLFKKSASTMVKNADKAYKTAGMSANEYMEQATSFGAALIKSTGGDTKKAAKAADRAIIDMSDNANKMGTNIGDIQRAYQGFAKGNYTMLDNLKLGYGGTKTEMERLLKDAEKLTGKKYDISNLSDVYEAIHVVQKDLGVTGTTAKEAASTLSGSFASMKAAASNFLGNLALGRNIAPSMKALADSAATFLFKNLLPAVGRIFKALPTAIVSFVKTGVPILRQAGMDLIKNITGGASAGQFGTKLGQIIISNAPKVISAIAKVSVTLVQYLLKGAGQLLKVGAALVTALAKGIGGAAVAKAKAAAQKVYKAVSDTIRKIISPVRNVVNKVKSYLGFSGLAGKVRAVFDKVKSAVTGPVKSAKETLSKVIKKITGLFPVNLGKILHLSVPKISVSGGKAPWGIGGKGKKPSFNVSWAEHAAGGIFKRPTLLDDLGGGHHLVGEAGPEAIMPLNTLWNKLDTLADNIVSGVATVNAAGEGAGAPMQVNLYAFPGGPQMDSWVVNTYDRGKRRLG